MESWKDVLVGMTLDGALTRARGMVGRGTVYRLGRGGFRPEVSLWSQGQTSDCSGFVAWAIGIPREFPPGSGHWLQTTTYWEGGGYPGTVPFRSRPLSEAMPGDLLVYPDTGGKQGHIGIVSAHDGQGATLIIRFFTDLSTAPGD